MRWTSGALASLACTFTIARLGLACDGSATFFIFFYFFFVKERRVAKLQVCLFV